MSAEHPTPADLRALAAAVDALAERIDAVQAALRAEDAGARRRAGFRLDDAAGELAGGVLERAGGLPGVDGHAIGARDRITGVTVVLL